MKCMVSVPHEKNGPFVAPLVFWLLRLPASFVHGHQLVFDSTPGGEYNVASSRNRTVRRFLESDCDWLWMIDADMDPWIDGLDGIGVQSVLDAMHKPDVDILTGFFFRMDKDGPVPSLTSSRGKKYITGEILSKPPGLYHVPTLAAGGACLAVKRHVFEDMLEKDVLWFQNELVEDDKEKWGDLKSSEDTWFFHYAQECGHKVWIDTNLVWGHVKPLDMRDELRRAAKRAGV